MVTEDAGSDLCRDILLPGTQIGRYRIERELGRGGMSVVYLATDVRLEKQWAVKTIRKIRRDGSGFPETDTLTAEAGLMKKLDHPSLPRIVDILEENGMLILVMDYIRGESLADLLKRSGPFPEKLVRDWLFRLASVLQYLHSQDPPVIYRDMKPANVIRKPDGTLVLLDLGIAREYKAEQLQDTVLLGTKGYAAPEQYGNAQTDIRSDIYSLGMTAAELLTGIAPSEDPYWGKIHPFRTIRPGISAGTEAILNRCLAFSPQDRYGSCEELMQDLRRKPAGRQRYGRSLKKKRIVILAALILLEIPAGVLTGSARPEKAQTEEKRRQEAEEILNYLEDCSRDGSFTKEEYAVFSEMFRELPETVLQDAGSYAEICFSAGHTCFFKYSGGGDSTFRERVLYAQPFFERALTCMEQAAAEKDLPEELKKWFSDRELPAERIRAYVRLCSFFSEYMFESGGFREPDSRDCAEILEAVQACLEEPVPEDTGDSAWLQLTLLRSMEELLYEYRESFADARIAQKTVEETLESIEEKAGDLHVRREKLADLRIQILAECAACREEIRQTYSNIDQWKEAEKVHEKKKTE